MTGPEQVLVNVADLRTVLGLERPSERPSGHEYLAALDRLNVAAIPVPEWEPTDDMRAKFRQVFQVFAGFTDYWVADKLKAMHQEGLL